MVGLSHIKGVTLLRVTPFFYIKKYIYPHAKSKLN